MTPAGRQRAWRQTDRGKKSHGVWKLNHPASYLLRKARDRASLKGLEFDLTKEWIEERLPKGCAVTGLPFEYAIGTAKRHNPWSPSVDRIDNDKGYVMSNCRLVVWMYNVAKSAWKDEDVMKMAKALV